MFKKNLIRLIYALIIALVILACNSNPKAMSSEPEIIILGFVTWYGEIITPTIVELETRDKESITQRTQGGIFLFRINKVPRFTIYVTDIEGHEWVSIFVIRDIVSEFYKYFDTSLIKEIIKTDDLIFIILELNQRNHTP